MVSSNLSLPGIKMGATGVGNRQRCLYLHSPTRMSQGERLSTLEVDTIVRVFWQVRRLEWPEAGNGFSM